MSEVIRNKYNFMILFDVTDGNPNGDPDTGMPRIDPETGYGIVTDVCLKRKIRDFVEMVKEDEPGYRIYIKKSVPLNRNDAEAYEYLGVTGDTVKAARKDDPDIDLKIRDFMCRNFFDIRTFGGTMTTFTKGALSCGQIRGPVQLGFARSVDPVTVNDMTITRCAITTEEDAQKKQTEFGEKATIPYGLYKVTGSICAYDARKVTGFSEDDLELLWQAIRNMFGNDHCAARANMEVKELIVFKHDTELGLDYSEQKLYESVDIKKKPDVKYPRKYEDYDISIHKDQLPDTVEVTTQSLK